MKKFECEFCKKRFHTEAALNQHKNAKHGQDKVTPHEDKGGKITISTKHTKRLWLYLVIIGVIAFIGWGIYAAVTNPSQIGALGSTHQHADFGIFINGQELTPLPTKYFVRSQYVHVEDGPGAGSVLHLHATNVPLDLFFKSLGMSFDANCLKLDTGQQYCNDGDRTLKMYVKHVNGEWQQNTEYENYIPRNLDKILISYGNESEDEIQQQTASVTDFSDDNLGRLG